MCGYLLVLQRAVLRDFCFVAPENDDAQGIMARDHNQTGVLDIRIKKGHQYSDKKDQGSESK